MTTDVSGAPVGASLRVLALVTDAWGGHGGIAQFNRDYLRALGSTPGVADLLVLARTGSPDSGSPPPGVAFHRVRRGGKAGYFAMALRAALTMRPDCIVIGHINLTVLGVALARLVGARTVLHIHGAEAWRPRRSRWINRMVRGVDLVASVSALTFARFNAWSPDLKDRGFLLPCCVDLTRFRPGPRPEAMATRLGLHGRRVLLSLARLASEERLKGIDEMLEQMPELARRHPDLVYLVGGDGSDIDRLRAKAVALGVGAQVIFAGHVPERDKTDFYRLGDAFVLPSRGEGFGIVLLEAMACGLPVLGSRLDATAEVLEQGAWGVLVDPGDPASLSAGIDMLLRRERTAAASDRALAFGEPAFRNRVVELVRRIRHARAGSGDRGPSDRDG